MNEHAEPERRARVIFDALTRAADEAGMGVSIAYVTADGAEMAYANEASWRLFGVSRAELFERPIWSFIAPDEIPRLLAMHEQRLRGETPPTRFETIVVRADGTHIPVEISTTRVDLDGRPANVTFVLDVSHRRHAQEALERSEARFRSLAESAPDGIAILRWPIIAYLNRRAAELLGFGSAAEAVGQNILDRLVPTAADLADERVRRRQRGENMAQTAEYRVRGHDRTIEVSATPIEYEGGPAILGFARDITERKAMVARLTESEKLAALGTLIAGVAHEINNPLAYVLLNLELVQRLLPQAKDNPTLMAELQKRMDEARHGGERVKTIVRDLQTVARRDAGERVPVPLDGAVDAALSIAAHELRQATQVVRKFESARPVLGNATRFEQLFLNLIMNAVHAIATVPPERRVIELALGQTDPTTVVATVRDHGTGMSEETLSRALDPFFTTKPVGVGTGLGLPICQGIVHSAGGRLELVSELDKGTTVTIWLPAFSAAVQ